jgi:hypothetical protein
MPDCWPLLLFALACTTVAIVLLRRTQEATVQVGSLSRWRVVGIALLVLGALTGAVGTMLLLQARR